MKTLLVILLLSLVAPVAASPMHEPVRRMLARPYTNPDVHLLSASDFILRFTENDIPLRLELYRTEALPAALKMENERAYAGIAWIYYNLGLCYMKLEDNLKRLSMMDSALYWIDKSDNTERKARIYRVYADCQIRCGSIEKGHRYYYKSIGLYETLKGFEKEISACYYQLATGYLQMLDFEGIDRIIAKMKELNRKSYSAPCLYDLYSVQTAKFGILKSEHPQNRSFIDSAFFYSHKSIDLIEKHEKELPGTMPAWNYYNLALFFDENFDPPKYDSIAYYLDKAMQAKLGIVPLDREVDISVYDLQAWVFYQQKQYGKAEERMKEVIRLLDLSGDVNSLTTEYGEAYGLLVKIYEETGRPALALNYQKRMNEVYKKRFDQEKMGALKELEVKYEVEKKENQISWLEERNRTAGKIILLVVSFLAALTFVLILILVLFRMRKRNLEQKVYEAALTAELKQEELAQSRAEKRHLQEEFERISALAGENRELAMKYEEQLEAIRQKIDQGTVSSVIGKMKESIEQAPLDAETKTMYTKKLLSLNTDEMEKLFLPVNDKMTSMDLKYILCFYINMDAKEIGLLFNVEAASVYTVRYRIRKKFRNYPFFKFLMG